ncbi:MAG: hypothetical protein FJZ01_23235 [Candidatus Sericytochromatia bacterium]|nr:hypothetical protein [Candidatus Tanganyikabacteria bacterium]
MVSRPVLRRAGILALAGTLYACAAGPQPAATGPAPPDRQGRATYHVSQAAEPDVGLLAGIPASIPAGEARQRLAPIALEQVSGSFQSDVFMGQTGVLRGFAPGFTAELLERSLFLQVGDLMVPYMVSDGQYVPVAMVDQARGVYLYPALVLEAGILVPIYFVARGALEPYSLFLPVDFPPTYVSPINIILVPAPIVIRPIIIRPRPRPRPTPTATPPRPEPTPTMVPPHPEPGPTIRPPRPEPAPTLRPPRPDRPRPPRPDRPRPPLAFEPPDDLERFPIVVPDDALAPLQGGVSVPSM